MRSFIAMQAGDIRLGLRMFYRANPRPEHLSCRVSTNDLRGSGFASERRADIVAY
jgi:hypothetical protein